MVRIVGRQCDDEDRDEQAACPRERVVEAGQDAREVERQHAVALVPNSSGAWAQNSMTNVEVRLQ